jgi:hypothetical protein
MLSLTCACRVANSSCGSKWFGFVAGPGPSCPDALGASHRSTPWRARCSRSAAINRWALWEEDNAAAAAAVAEAVADEEEGAVVLPVRPLSAPLDATRWWSMSIDGGIVPSVSASSRAKRDDGRRLCRSKDMAWHGNDRWVRAAFT